jgi:hypothetical protein
MKLHPRLPLAIPLLAFATIFCATALSAHPAPQFNPSHSDEDINTIGHLTIAKSTNFYSLDKEKKLGEALA